MSPVSNEYFQRYAIARIDLEMQAGVVDSADPVCNLSIQFTPGYQVQFKLQGEQALLGKLITGFLPDGQVVVRDSANSPDMEARYTTFFRGIESRLDRIAHEEKVQAITFLGNTFILNNKTVFDVVADEDGQLSISIHKGAQRQPAMLLASSLLDGLYDRSIVLVEKL